MTKELERLVELARQLPTRLDSDWEGSNHFELHDNSAGGDYFWMDFTELVGNEDDCGTEHGKRVGLIMDCVAQLAKALPDIEALTK